MKRKQPKTIPTLLGIIILVISVILGVFLIGKSQTFSLKATEEISPREVKITNLNNSSFTVSWITRTATNGFISFGESVQLGQTALEDQEKGVTLNQPKSVHYVTLENLSPSTKYFFKINSGSKLFDREGKPYEVTTGPTINLPLPTADTAYGIILESNGNPAKGAIVYLSLANTTPLSSLVKNDGSWVIPLSMARTITLSSYSGYDREIQVEEIFVQGGNLGTATAITTTKNDNPVPSLTLGQVYDFRQAIPTSTPTSASSGSTGTGGFFLGSPGGTTPTATPSPESSGFLSAPSVAPPLSDSRLNILNPDEGEKINSQKPEFIGTAPGGKVLEITLESETTFSGQVLVDDKGNWQWTPPANLPPGEHTITVILKDKEGLAQKIVRNFTVLAVGESNLPSFEATPSAVIRPTSAPTAEPTRVVATPTEKPVQPKTGNLTSTFLFFTIGLILLLLGISQFKWTR